ncbi:MAG: 16S rRNA (guanine527-N7)-methyltransferase [Alphaproteobacteria bacterium]|jgi:16S rRNA (guanine527-N7)-methyltransferase
MNAFSPKDPIPLTPAGFAEATNVSRETLCRLETYADLLVKMQKTLNLVGQNTLSDIWRRHFLDSAQLLPLLPSLQVDRPVVLLDLGSGAGFPGLILALMTVSQPLDVHLVESDTRKCAFLREAARLTETRIHLHNCRIEVLEPFKVDVISARALAPLDRLIPLMAPFLTLPGASPEALLLRGAQGQEELTRGVKGWKMRVETIPSITDQQAMVLRLKDITLG